MKGKSLIEGQINQINEPTLQIEDFRSFMEFRTFGVYIIQSKFKIFKLRNTYRKMSQLVTRENWQSHKNFNSSGASFLTHIHDSFREETLNIEKLISQNKIKQASNRFDHLENSLHHHHKIEEQTLFKYMKTKIDKKSESDLLFSDHKKMSTQLDSLIKLLEKYQPEQLDQLKIEWKDFMDHLNKHLDEEEDICIPIIVQDTFKAMW